MRCKLLLCLAAVLINGALFSSTAAASDPPWKVRIGVVMYGTLRARGLQVVVHTNATLALTTASLGGAGLTDAFDRIVSVDPVRVYKPHPAAYQHLLATLDLDRREIFFVSSNAWDAHGAAHFGLPSAWINRSGFPDDALPGQTVELPSFDGLVAAVLDGP